METIQIAALIVLEANLQVLLEEAQDHLVVVLTSLQMEEHLVVTVLEEMVIQVEVLEVDQAQEILEEILDQQEKLLKNIFM